MHSELEKLGIRGASDMEWIWSLSYLCLFSNCGFEYKYRYS